MTEPSFDVSFLRETILLCVCVCFCVNNDGAILSRLSTNQISFLLRCCFSVASFLFSVSVGLLYHDPRRCLHVVLVSM